MWLISVHENGSKLIYPACPAQFHNNCIQLWNRQKPHFGPLMVSFPIPSCTAGGVPEGEVVGAAVWHSERAVWGGLTQQPLLATQPSRSRRPFVPFWCKMRRFTLNDTVPDPWGTHSPPVGNTISTHGEHGQYRWGTRSVPVGNAISTGGEHDQYRWGTRPVPVGNAVIDHGESS